uniref:Calcineurin-like phosphoesterase domain-containing protein n=1 Tax=Plectus sambesii TaxID=2011161 RepID=A0A914VWY4_9BILA
MDGDLVEVDPLFNRPVDLWRKYVREGRVCRSARTLRLNTPIFPDKVRFVCISDTHEQLGKIIHRIPDGDILIHAGDFTDHGDLGEVAKFNSELAKLPHKHKLVVAGNHEIGFEVGEKIESKRSIGLKMLGMSYGFELLSNCTYLCDKEVKIYGLKIYGAPWHPMPGYSFFRSRGQQLLNKWNQIPRDTDVLITHTPPLGHGDYANWRIYDGMLSGCAELLNTVEKRVKPQYHVFGHIHDQHGATTNGETTFINASICDHLHRCPYDPIIFDVPLPDGVTKD